TNSRYLQVALPISDFAANSGGVDELPLTSAEHDKLIDRIDGRSRDIVYHHTLLSGQRIQQTRLADIGFTDNGDPRRSGGFIKVFIGRVGQCGQYGVQ